jgi:hypothetical protein
MRDPGKGLTGGILICGAESGARRACVPVITNSGRIVAIATSCFGKNSQYAACHFLLCCIISQDQSSSCRRRGLVLRRVSQVAGANGTRRFFSRFEFYKIIVLFWYVIK